MHELLSSINAATVGEGISLVAKGLGRMSWIAMSSEPANPYLQWTVKTLRIAGTLQIVLLLALHRFEKYHAGQVPSDESAKKWTIGTVCCLDPHLWARDRSKKIIDPSPPGCKQLWTSDWSHQT